MSSINFEELRKTAEYGRAKTAFDSVIKDGADGCTPKFLMDSFNKLARVAFRQYFRREHQSQDLIACASHMSFAMDELNRIVARKEKRRPSINNGNASHAAANAEIVNAHMFKLFMKHLEITGYTE